MHACRGRLPDARPPVAPVDLAMARVVWRDALKIVADFARRNGYFVHLNPRTGIILQVLAGIYALSMVVRYVLTMALHPELRWFTGTIPIWFHFVLAAFIFTLGRYPLRHNLPPRPVP